MKKLDTECLSPLKLFERLVKLETAVEVGRKKDAEALVLARNIFESERDRTSERIDYKFEKVNEFQKRMDRLEATFATKSDLKVTDRLVYAGVGIVLTVQFSIGIIFAIRLWK